MCQKIANDIRKITLHIKNHTLRVKNIVGFFTDHNTSSQLIHYTLKYHPIELYFCSNQYHQNWNLKQKKFNANSTISFHVLPFYHLNN